MTEDPVTPSQEGSGSRMGARVASAIGRSRTVRFALIAAALVAGPLLGILLITKIGPAILWLESPDSGPFWLSLRVALIATALAGTAGLGAGYLLAKKRFPGRDLLEAIGSVPIILPPTVLGYYLLQLLGDGNFAGRALTRLIGRPIVFTVTGCVVAASIAAFPFCMRAARAAIEGVDPRLEQAARAMGLPAWRVALQVTVPLARRGIAAGVTLGGMRALGEYGATLMVGGNIPGSTRTMSLAVADAHSTSDRHTLVLILVFMALAALAVISRLGRSRRTA
jgi:molybdate transport system permease protein